jgi:hypothetical protein
MASGGKNKVNLAGMKFGMLTVLQEDGSSKHGLALWKCQCDCGEIITTSGYYLRMDRRKSCGCRNFRLRGSDNPKWSGHEEISGSYWHNIKSGAIARNLEMEITIKIAWNKFLEQNKKCALTGIELKMFKSDVEKRLNNEQTASLDRIDNNKGYVEGNIQWVHKDINKIKMDLNTSYFIELCKKVTKHATEQLV